MKSRRSHDLFQLIDDVERETVDRLNWDFSSCPPDELDECHAYEFARNLTPIRKDVARLRKGKRQTFAHLFATLKKVVFAPASPRRYALFWFYSGVPREALPQHFGKRAQPAYRSRLAVQSTSRTRSYDDPNGITPIPEGRSSSRPT